MRLYGLLQLVIALLRYKGRLTYVALQHEFGLDDATLDAIRHELIFAERVATDEAGRVLVWAGEAERAACCSAPHNSYACLCAPRSFPTGDLTHHSHPEADHTRARGPCRTTRRHRAARRCGTHWTRGHGRGHSRCLGAYSTGPRSGTPAIDRDVL